MRPVPKRADLLALRRAAGEAVRLRLTELAEPAVSELVTALAGGKPDGDLLRLATGPAGIRSTSPNWSPRWPVAPG